MHLDDLFVLNDFRSKLVEEMIDMFPFSRHFKQAGRPNQLEPYRLTERYFHDFIPPTEKKWLHIEIARYVTLKRHQEQK